MNIKTGMTSMMKINGINIRVSSETDKVSSAFGALPLLIGDVQQYVYERRRIYERV